MARRWRLARRLPRRLRLERRRFGTGAAHARGRRRPGGTGSPATRLRLQGRRRLRRGAQDRCARDAGSVGAVAARAWRGAREQARDQARGSQRPQRLVVASRRVRLPCRLAARCASAAARWRSPGGRRVAERCASSARSKSRSLPGRAGAERYRCATCASRTFRSRRPPRVAASSKAAGARAGARPPSHGGYELAQRGRRVARVALARLRPRARVWRSRHRLGGGGRRPRVRSAELRRRRRVDDACDRDAGRGRTQLRLPAGRRLLAAFAAVPARASCRRRTASRSACSMCDRSTSRAHSPISSTPSPRASRADITRAGCTASSRTGRLRALQAGRPRRS